MARILIADDDVELCELLTEYLTSEGFRIETVNDGESAVDRVLEGDFDALVLDVMLPQLNGFDALRRIRRRSTTPVLMLTARGEDVDRIVGLEMGADDYMPKPCNPRELSARLRAILRRTAGSNNAAAETKLTVGDVMLDTAARKVTCGGEEKSLTGAEFKVLEALLLKSGEIVSKAQLAQFALGRRLTPYDRSIDVHISNLRKKLGPHPDDSQRIKTVRGAGYQYSVVDS